MPIDTLKMQTRREYVSQQCHALFKCNETSGNVITDSVAGIVYDQGNVDVSQPDYTTYGAPHMQHEISNAVRIENRSGVANGTANARTYTDVDWNVDLDSDKVILLAAHIRVERSMATRIHMGQSGTPEGNLSISLSGAATGEMHDTYHPRDQTFGAARVDDGLVRDLRAGSLPKTIYALWDGKTQLLRSVVLDSAGAIDVDTVSGVPLSLYAATPQGGYPSGLRWQPTAKARWTGANYYCVALWELDVIPAGLHGKLAQWGQMAMLGFKSAPDL